MIQMTKKPIRIVKYNKTGQLGTLLEKQLPEGIEIHFYPAGYGQYWIEQLPLVTEGDLSETSLAEKIIYLKMMNTWGDVVNTHIINDGEYVILEVVHTGSINRHLYQVYLHFRSISQSYETLDSAIIGVLNYKYQGNNSQAGIMFERMLQMEEHMKLECLPCIRKVGENEWLVEKYMFKTRTDVPDKRGTLKEIIHHLNLMYGTKDVAED